MCLEEKEQEEGDGDRQGACCHAGASVRGREGPKGRLGAAAELTTTNKKSSQLKGASVGPSPTTQKMKQRCLGQPNTVLVPRGVLK